MTNDAELLRRFVDEGSEAAFRELVEQRINFVYAVALRQVGGDTHLAQDVVQSVFLDLTRKARELARRPTIMGWLHTSARFAAAKARRSRVRRLNHETEALTMNEILSAPATAVASEADWNELRPVLDAVLHELGEADREALLLRYFEGRSLGEVGGAIGLSENSARMRVDRALEKLRARLARRGITSTAAALGVVLANQPAVAAPAGLAATVFSSSLVGAAIRGAGVAAAWAALDFMTKLKIALSAATLFAAVGTGTYLIAQQARAGSPPVATGAANAGLASLQAENQRLNAEVTRLQKAVADAAPSPLAELRALVLAVQQKVVPPIYSLVRLDKDKVSPGFAALFNLTAEEKTAVETELVNARDELGVLNAANVAGVDRPAANSVVIRFKSFPEAGGKIHDRLVGALAQTLGAERFAALQTLMGDGVDWVLGSGFGAVDHSMTVERRAFGPANPAMLYTIFDRTQSPAQLPSGGPQRSLSSVSTVGVRPELNQKYAWLAKLLPEDF